MKTSVDQFASTTEKSPLTLKRANTDEPIATKKLKIIDKENLPDDNDEPQSIVPVLDHSGTAHLTSKQYLIYEHTVPNLISRTARLWCLKYRQILAHVDPDAYDMYVHNDFVCYGELEVIENCLLHLAKGIPVKPKVIMTLPRAINAFRRWEALILLLDYASAFVGIDDGSRFTHIVRLIGACSVTILRYLLPATMFKPIDNQSLNANDIDQLKKISERLLNFKQVLEQALRVGHQLLSVGQIPSAFTNILQTVYCNWLWIMEKIRFDWTQQPMNIDRTLWQAVVQGNGIKKTRFHESFNFHKEFSLYRNNYPDLGGNAHDLRKWPKARRNMYSFNTQDDENYANFWFRV